MSDPVSDAEIAELRKLLREVPTVITDFKDAAAGVMLTAKAREVLPRLLDEVERFREALRRKNPASWRREAVASITHVGPPPGMKPIKE